MYYFKKLINISILGLVLLGSVLGSCKETPSAAPTLPESAPSASPTTHRATTATSSRGLVQINEQEEEPRCDKVDMFIHTDPLAIPYPSIQPRLLKWAVPPIETDPYDGTFVYDVCLTYYGINGETPPPNPSCVESTSPGPVEFDVYAGYRFDLESSIELPGANGQLVTLYSVPSYCVIVTGGSDVNGDGITGGPDFGLLSSQFGMAHKEPF